MLGGKHVQWKILAERRPEFVDDVYLPTPKKDDPPFVFNDPCRWNVEQLRIVWGHWRDRQKRKTQPLKFNKDAFDTLKSKGRVSTKQAEEEDEDKDIKRTADGDGSASPRSVSEDERPKGKGRLQTTRKGSSKQLKVAVKGGRVVVNKAAGFAPEDPNKEIPYLDRVEPAVSMGPPEPGQKRVAITDGKVTIEQAVDLGQKGIVRPDQTAPATSPCGSPLPKMDFLRTLCEDKIWTGVLKAIDKIPVRQNLLICCIVIATF